jgi:hypothetical protein
MNQEFRAGFNVQKIKVTDGQRDAGSHFANNVIPLMSVKKKMSDFHSTSGSKPVEKKIMNSLSI